MLRIITKLLNGLGETVETIEIGEARTRSEADDKVKNYFSYVEYEGADSFDREAMRNVEYLGDEEKTKRDDRLRCHYCGQPLRKPKFGFFDEPVCRECGGEDLPSMW